MNWTLLEGDCLEVMKDIPDDSVDLILSDLPYGTTNCRWDSIIPLELLWEHYKRLIKSNGAIVLTASQPFTTKLISSNYDMFRYEWIYNKTMGTNPALVKKMPFKKHENILVFYNNQPTYNPQMEEGKPYIDKRNYTRNNIGVHGEGTFKRKPINNTGYRYPSSVQLFKNSNHKSLHPTQKPVALFEYLIKTYTNEGEMVLDNCAGSGTTGEACYNTNRNCIMIEKEPEYCEIIKKRMKEVINQLKLGV